MTADPEAAFHGRMARVTPRPPEPSPEALSSALLARLRRAFAAPRIGYAVPPTRLSGGTNCFIYRFLLSDAPPELGGALVLRLYPRGRGERRVVKEATFQNAVAAAGYPAPRVRLHEADPSLLGGAFLVAEFRPGSVMEFSAALPGRLAEFHAALHDVDPAPAVEAFRGLGREEPCYRFDAAAEIAMLEEWPRLPERLRPVVGWLSENRPPEGGRSAICHGDFHPFNVLVDGSRVTGVLDWSNVTLARPELDVARTMAFAAVAARHLPDLPDLSGIMRRYLARYRELRAVDGAALAYFGVRHSVLALANAAGSWAVWQDPAIVRELEAGIRRATGIALA